MMRFLILLGTLLALARPVYAGSAATVAAALPDEASECRYLLGLLHDREAAHARGAIGRSEELTTDLHDAAKVVRAKHAQAPSCFEDLYTVFRRDAFE